MKSPKLLIHIGYHKTATTWMQRQLFTPNHGYRQLLDHQAVFKYLVKPHGLSFNPNAVRQLILSEMRKLDVGQSPVISSEILSGHPFFGGRESDILAKRLAVIAPQAQILISIRNQLRILPSLYMQYLRRGGTMDYAQFFEGSTDLHYYGFEPEHFEYHRLIKFYQNLFGASQVFVLPQESLITNQNTILRELAEFAGNSKFSELLPDSRRAIGVSHPELTWSILRCGNHFRASALNAKPLINLRKLPFTFFRYTNLALTKTRISKLIKDKRPVSKYVEKHFSDYFVESNQALRSIVSDEVSLKGYPGIQD